MMTAEGSDSAQLLWQSWVELDPVPRHVARGSVRHRMTTDVLAWWMSRRGGGCPGVVVDVQTWWWMLWCGGGCPGVVGMPWRDDPARGWGTALLVPLWQSCVGVGVVPRHVAGEVVRCRIATVARSASPAPCGSCPQVGECGSGAAGVGCALERWVSFYCAGFVHGTSSSDVWQSWC